ncbi:MAG TPA: hypothetical protein VLB86_12680 [Gaiellaceae bacterium]|nr:hypothetical protein [Gaiellaceae bacterium]
MTARAAVAEHAGAPVAGVARARARAFDGALVLSVATGLSGVLIYAFHVLAARSLGPEAYGRIAVLWAALFVGVVVLFRPLEQTTARAIAERRSRGADVRSVLRAVTIMAAVVVVLLTTAIVLGWDVISSSLFGGDATLTAALALGLVAYAAAYVIRGVTSGLRWFSGYGLLLLADALARIVVALPLVVVASEGLAAAAMVAAGVASVAAVLWAGRSRLGTLLAPGHGASFRLRSAASFAGPASVIAAADQVLVNGGPLVVVLAGGSGMSREAGVVFAATMLVRVPVFLFQGLAASLLPNLTTLHAQRDGSVVARAAWRACAAIAGVTVAIVLAATVAGPSVMALVYGEEYRVDALELGLLAAGVGAYLAAATLSQLLLALDRGRAAAVAWAGAAVVFVASYAVIPGEPLLRIAVGFAVAAGAVAFALATVVARSSRHSA